MAGEWQTLTLREAGVTLIDCDHRTPPAAEDGYPYVTIPQLRGGRIDLGDVRRITQEHFIEWTRKARPQASDIVLSRRCNPGETAYVPPDLEFALGQNLVLLRADGKRVYPPFLRWLTRSPDWWSQIDKFLNVGAVFDSLRCADVPHFELKIPPLPEQRAIARILGTLDDKIELNLRMNKTLEATARALFKSWFVDFDPVRAKAEGRDPGLPQPLADLFPDSFEHSELGQIPRGWEMRTVEKVCSTVTRGVTPKYEAGSQRYIINQRVNRGARLDLTELKELACSLEVPAACYAKRWDVLVNCLGEGTLGRVHLFRGTSDEYAVDQHMSICRGVTSGVGAYLYQTLSSPAGQEKIESLKTGSTGMTMFNISKLRSFDFLWPGDALVQAYFQITEPKLTHVAANEEQSRTLAALRDALLPKLISGELRIEEPARFLGGGD